MLTDTAARPDAVLDPPLQFHPLTFLDDGPDVVVGRPDIDAYVVIPTDGAALLRRLCDGDERAAAARWYAETYGETVDIEDFVQTLRELDLLCEDAPDPALNAPGGTSVRWQRLGAAVFSRTAGALYLLIVLAAVAVAVVNPLLAPRHQNVFFTDSFLVIELCLFALQLPLVLVHECAHVLAGRRLGLRTRVRISRRLYFLVFETVMNGLVSVPRAKRYLPMLAGMGADLLVAAGFTLAAWSLVGSSGEIGFWAGLFLALAFTTLLRIGWQLYFFLRTDVYYLVTTVLGCVDLHAAARQYLANAANRLLNRPSRLVNPETWHPRDRHAVRWYAPLMVIGYIVAIGVLVLVMVPIAWTFLSTAVRRVGTGDVSDHLFWDSALLLALNAGQLGAAGWLAVRERRAAARSRPAARHRLAPPRPSRPRHAMSRRASHGRHATGSQPPALVSRTRPTTPDHPRMSR